MRKSPIHAPLLASAAVFLGVALLWGRSYRADDGVRWLNPRGGLVGVNSPCGCVVFCRIAGGDGYSPSNRVGLTWFSGEPWDLDRQYSRDLDFWPDSSVPSGDDFDMRVVRMDKKLAGFRWQTEGMAKIHGFHTSLAPRSTPPSGTDAWFILVPYWFLAAAALAPTVLFGRRLAMQMRRSNRNECLKCGYDLRASPGRCPECGAIRPTNPLNSGAAQRCLT